MEPVTFEQWWGIYRYGYLNGPSKKHAEAAFNSRQQEIDRLKAELGGQKELTQRRVNELITSNRLHAETFEQLAEVGDKLAEYASHRHECTYVMTVGFADEPEPCDCGLDSALSAWHLKRGGE